MSPPRAVRALTVAVSLASVASASAVGQAPSLVQRHVSLDLTVDYDAGTVSGSAGHVVENAGQAPVRELAFLLGRLMTVSAIRISDTRHGDWSQDVVTFPDWPSYQANEVRVYLDEPLAPGASARVDIEYGGVLVGYTETGMRYVRDRVSEDFTILRGDALAFPQPGTASLASMRAQRREDFTFDAAVTVPEGLVVAAAVPGERSEGVEGVRWSFRSRAPVPFLLIAVASYRVISEGATRVFHFPQDSVGAARILEEATAADALYTRWFGESARDLPVTIMEIPEGWGSQASLTGGIIQTADSFRSAAALPELYHELAHLRHPRETEVPADRWNEGLATYLQWRVAEARDPAFDFEGRMESIAASVVRDDEARPVTVEMTAYGENGLTGLAYRSGALLFFALERRLGRETLDGCLGGWFGAFVDSGSGNEDFAESLTTCDARAAAVLDTWFVTTRWIERLRAGASLDEVVRQ